MFYLLKKERKYCFIPAKGTFHLSTDFSAKTRSDRDFEMSLCYTPKAFSCLEEI